MKRMDEEEMYSATPAGRTGTGTGTGTGGAGGAGGAYGDIGTTGRRNQMEKAQNADTRITQYQQLKDMVAEGFDTEALGPEFFRGTWAGELVDRMGAYAGLESSKEDLDFRNRVKALSVDQVMQTLKQFPGTTTDFEFRVSSETVPDVNASKKEWDLFFADLEEQLAVNLNQAGTVGSLEEGRQFVAEQLGSREQANDPEAQKNRYREAGDRLQSKKEMYRP
jgi:hypothetical protein